MNKYVALIQDIFLNKEYIENLKETVLQYTSEELNLKDYILSISLILQKAWEHGTNRVLDHNGEIVKTKPSYTAQLQTIMLSQLSYIKNIDKEVREKIRKVLEEGIKKGLTYAEMSDQLVETTKKIVKTRAMRIARTEIVRTTTKAMEATLKSNGFKKYMWISANDKKTCPICRNRHGKIYEFREGNPLPPAHPNCRCVIVKA